MITLICERIDCGKKYKTYPSRKKNSHYCSKACFDEARRHYRICEECGKKFRVCLWDVEQGQARYCSKKCRGIADRNAHAKQCPYCHRMFLRKRGDSQRKFCSVEHYKLWKQSRRKHDRPITRIPSRS